MRFRKCNILFFSALIFILGSCASIGPKHIDLDRANYNDIIWQTDLEQLLKNIVRLRYIETSSYFQVTNVTASSSLVQSVSGQLVGPPSSLSYYPQWSAGPQMVYTDSPTISYAPIGNAAFVASLEKPVNFNYFILLTHGARYGFDDLAKVMLSRIGPLANSPSATSLSVYELPDYKPFYRFVDLVEKMLTTRAIIPKPIYFNETLGIMLRFQQKNSANALLLKKMVGVPANSENIIIMPEGEAVIVQEKNGQLVVPPIPNKLSNVVYAQTRSINAMLTFLSHAVHVPHPDIKAHMTLEGHYPDNTVFNWNPLMKGVLTIHCANFEPMENVMIKTYVNHHWFYIKASDVDSKMTLYLVIKLIEIVSVLPPQYQGPSLTLPG